MTKPAAYLRPRMGHALSMASLRVLPMLQSGMRRRMQNQKPDAGFELQDAVLQVDALFGVSTPSRNREDGGKETSAGIAPETSQTDALSEARVLSNSAKALRPSAPKTARGATLPNRRLATPRHGLHVVKKTNKAQSVSAQNRPVPTRKAPSLMAAMVLTSDRLKTRSLASAISGKEMQLSRKPAPDISALFALKSPLAAVTALHKAGGFSPTVAAKPAGAGGNHPSSNIAEQPAQFDTQNLMPSGVADASTTQSLTSQKLQALVKSLLHPESPTAIPAPTPRQPESADDGFEIEMQLRAALGHILAQDMLRHGLRMPGVF